MRKQGLRAFIFQSLLQMFFGFQSMAQEKPQPDAEIVKTTLTSAAEVNTYLLNLWKQGYLFGDVKAISDSSLYVYKGGQYAFRITSINDSVPENQKKPFRFSQNQLNYWNNHGYPFSIIGLSEIRQTGAYFTSNLNIEKGQI